MDDTKTRIKELWDPLTPAQRNTVEAILALFVMTNVSKKDGEIALATVLAMSSDDKAIN